MRTTPGTTSPDRAGRREAGFTLIEVILALVITVMTVTVIAQGFELGGRASVGAQFRTRAAWLAEMILTDVETGEIAHNRSEEGEFQEEEHQLFRYRVESDADETTNVYRITVTILWDERGREDSYSLTRLLYRPQQEEP